ncbi:MAG: GTP cyclohydrolase MptA [Candidatus Hodarchaeota archaeon]
MSFHRDVQSENADFNFEIQKVGIQDVKKRIEINRKDGNYSINLDIKAFINLPENQRGIHMSRSAESIDECITEHVYAPMGCVEEFGVNIARSLLDKHAYASKSYVELEGPLILQMRQREDRESTQSDYFINCKVSASRKNDNSNGYDLDIRLGAIAQGIIACPCGQEMSREFSKEILSKRKDIAVDEETIETILNVIPLATHNQRATGRIMVQEPEAGTVDVLQIIKVIEGSMSGKISGILKRPDEAFLIRVAHQDPLFTEDVLRRMALNLANDEFDALSDEMEVEMKIISMESIHPHQATAATKTTLGRLRAALEQKNKT